MVLTQGCRNYTLLLLLLTIIVFCANQLVFSAYSVGGNKVPYRNVFRFIFNADQGLIHWIITQAYLKVAYETSQLLDRGVLFNDPEKIKAVYKFKFNMKIANVICPLLVIGFTVCICVSYVIDSDVLYFVGEYGQLGMLVIFSVVWGWTLYKLYRDTVHSKKLLPHKNIFILHGSLLAFCLLMYAINTFASFKALHSTGSVKEYWDGIYELCSFVANLAEAVTFVLVVFLMIPIGKHQQFKRAEFQRFLFVGFMDRRELEEAIRLQYPDLTEK